jgi:hypothetical protein
MSRRIAWGLSIALLGAGAVTVTAGIVAAGRHEPAQGAWGEHMFVVKRRDQVVSKVPEMLDSVHTEHHDGQRPRLRM